MTDTELLQAIGKLIDEKFDEKLQPISAEIAELRSDVSKDIAELRSDVSKDIAELRTDVSKDIAEIKTDISEIKEQLHDVNDAIGLITDWIEKASALNRIPFLEAK